MLIGADLERCELGRVHDLAPLRSLVLEHVGAGVGRGVAGHVELHADLVELQRGQLAGDERARLPVQGVDVVVEHVARRHRDRVPEVVRVVALVVVAHAGVGADDRRGFVDPVGVDLGRDERRAVAEGPRVEDRRQLAQHAELLDPRDPVADFGLGETEALAERGVRPGLEREVPLHRVQQLAVEFLELSVVGHGAHGRAGGRTVTKSPIRRGSGSAGIGRRAQRHARRCCGPGSRARR